MRAKNDPGEVDARPKTFLRTLVARVESVSQWTYAAALAACAIVGTLAFRELRSMRGTLAACGSPHSCSNGNAVVLATVLFLLIYFASWIVGIGSIAGFVMTMRRERRSD